MKSAIYKLHKKIYNFTKKKAESFLDHSTTQLKKYKKDQRTYANRIFMPVTEVELLTAIKKSQIIYLGDVHTFDQNTRNLERIIRELVKGNKKFILALEMVSFEHQDFIDAYLQLLITELEFLESINYHESWRFPWNHYKKLFLMAREYNFDIHGINSPGDLKQRDYFAASYLAKIVSQNPQNKVLVLFGEHHIVPNKIPAQVKKIATKLKLSNIKQIILHQNLDEVYWKIRNRNFKNKIFKFTFNEYVLQSSPPWIKYESIIYWYENLCNDPEFDLHNLMIEKGLKAFGSDASDNFILILREIIISLRIVNISRTEEEDFELFDQTKLEKVYRFLDGIKDKPLIKFYESLILIGESFRIPFSRKYYCPNYSINKLSQIAGLHISFTLSKNNGYSLEQALKEKNQVNLFFVLFYHSMVSYFSSKIINPFRKCDLYKDLHLQTLDKDIANAQKSLISKSLKIIDGHENIKRILGHANFIAINEIAKIVGHFYAEIFFDKVSKMEYKNSQKYIREFIFHGFFDIERLQDLRALLIGQVNYKEKRKHFF